MEWNKESPILSNDGFETIDTGTTLSKQKIHLRLIQRNARCSMTIIEGLDKKINLKKLLTYLKTILNCGGNIVMGEETASIKLSGDHRNKVRDFLITSKIADKEDIIVHGC